MNFETHLEIAEQKALVEKAQSGDEGALNTLITTNMRFVAQVANRFQGYGVEFEDLMQEGALGMLHAAGKFDLSKGVNFLSYAVYWIKRAMSRAIAEHGNSVRIPPKRAEIVRKVRQLVDDAESKGEMAPTVDEIAEALGADSDDVLTMIRASHPALSLDERSTDTEGSAYEYLEVGFVQSAEDTFFDERLGDEIAALFAILNEREAGLLKAKYGFGGRDALTTVEIGEALGVSKQRVSQIERNALDKMRPAAVAAGLR